MSGDAPIGTLLDGYAAKTVEEIDLLVGKGLVGFSAVGAEDGSPAVMIFAGEKAGALFKRIMQIVPDLPEYREFIESVAGAQPQPLEPENN